MGESGGRHGDGLRGGGVLLVNLRCCAKLAIVAPVFMSSARRGQMKQLEMRRMPGCARLWIGSNTLRRCWRGTRGRSTPDEASTRMEMPELLGVGSSTRSAGDASDVEQSGQPAWLAAMATRSTGEGWADRGVLAVMLALVAGLERASATVLGAQGAC
jgi:hypothetical protein